MPYAGPAQAGWNRPSSSVPSAHSTSKLIDSSRPCSRARSVIRRANDRWQPAYTCPSWVYRSTGAQAQPGCPASTVTRSRSGSSRRSPPGPPMCLLVVMSSLTRKTSNTGDIPTPQPAARSSRPTGTVLARAMPALSTQPSATIVTPAPASRRTSGAARLTRSARSPGPRTTGPLLPAGVVTQHLVAHVAGLDLADRPVQDRDALVHLGFRHDQRRGDLHDVRVDAAVEHHQPEFKGAVHDLRHLAVSRFPRRAVTDGLQAQHQAQPAHIPDQRVPLLQFAEPAQQVAAGAFGPADQAEVLDLVQVRQRGGAGDRVAGHRVHVDGRRDVK